MTERTPFKIKYHHRYELRDWLRKEFPFIDTYANQYSPEAISTIEERVGEIVDACRQIEEIDLRSGSAYIEYYREDWKRIKTFSKEGDYNELVRALNILVDAIDVE